MAQFEDFVGRVQRLDAPPEKKRAVIQAAVNRGILQNLPADQTSENKRLEFLSAFGVQGNVLPAQALNQVEAPAQAPAAATPPHPDAAVAVAEGAPPPSAVPEIPGEGAPASVQASPPTTSPPPPEAGFFQSALDFIQDPENQATAISDFAAPTGGEIAGRAIGGALGTVVAPGVGTVVGALAGGAIGSAAGLVVGRTATGKEVSLEDAATEAAFSVVPDVLQRPIRAFARGAVRATGKAAKAVEGILAKEAPSEVLKIFDPPAIEETNKLFSLVRASGSKVKGDDLANALRGFDEAAWNRLKARVENVATLNNRTLGPGVSNVLDSIRGGADGVDLDLGVLQDLRSQLYKSIGDLDGLSGVDDTSLVTLIESIDGGIDKLLQSGDAGAEVLKKARDAWKRTKATEAMVNYVSKPPVSRMSADLNELTFNVGKLGQITREVDAGPIGKVSAAAGGIQQKLLRDLESVPGAKDSFNEWVGRIAKVRGQVSVDTSELTMAQVTRARAMIGTLLSTVTGRKTFEKIILSDPKPISFERLNVAFNAARRAADVSTRGNAEANQIRGLFP